MYLTNSRTWWNVKKQHMNGYVGISAMSLIDLHGTRLQYYKYANPQMCMDLIDNINKS